MKIRITKRTDTLFPENCPEIGSVHEVIDTAKGIDGVIATIKYRKVHIAILPGEYEVIKEGETEGKRRWRIGKSTRT